MILGNPQPGVMLGSLGADRALIGRFASPAACQLAKLSMLVDGLGVLGAGAQVATPVVYLPSGTLVGAGDEVSVPDGMAATWIDFPFLGAYPAGLALGVGDYYFGLQGGPVSGGIRVYGDVSGGDSLVVTDTYANGPAATFTGGTASYWHLALTGAIFQGAIAPAAADDWQLARLAFPDAQKALSSRPAVRASGTLTRAGWHGTTVYAERGSFAVAKTGSPYALLIGQRVKVTTRGTAHPRSVYAVVATEADLVEDLSLSRRLFLALEIPGLTDTAVVVEEVSEE